MAAGRGLRQAGVNFPKIAAYFGIADASAPEYSWSEIGDTADDILVVSFNEPVQTLGSGDFALGVTVKVNAVAVVISSAVLQPDDKTVHYTIGGTPDPNDVIAYIYDDGVGDISDLFGNRLASLAEVATNNIGTHYWFNSIYDSMHMAHLL